MISYLKRLDWGLLLPIGFLAVASLTVIASAAPELVPQQALWFAVGIIAAALLSGIDVRPLLNYRSAVYGIYIAAIALLVVTALVAPEIRHTRSWIVIGGAQIQTSEFAKVALIIALSYFFAKRHQSIAYVGNIIISLLYVAIPAFLVVRQPDLGTALILIAIWVGYIFASGIRPRHIAIGLVAAIVLLVLSWNSFLKPYQKERVLGLFYPERDPLGVNYNVIQSKIAIGSGGFLGKGFRQGTQVQLGFLPEAHTDFIFAALVEEWGLLGGTLVIAAFLLLLLRIIWIALESENNFSRLMCLGAIIMLLAHFVMNMGSATGVFPVVGVPFPFLSYGGSNLLTSFMLIGIIQSIAMRKAF